MRRPAWLITVAIASVASTGCSVRDTLPAPVCGPDSSVIIVAQSVPTASYVPCLGPMPPGWSVTTVEVNQDHSVIMLDSELAGQEAAVLRLDEDCPVVGAASLSTDSNRLARRHVIDRTSSSFRATTYYRFVGGCVTLAFDFDRGVSAAQAEALEDALVLITRDEFNEDIRQFVGEEV